MKKISALLFTLLLLVNGLFVTVPQSHAATTTFSYTGAQQTYVVPANVLSLIVDAQGAEAGDASHIGSKGKGGRVQTTLVTTPGETLYLYVGGQGNLAGTPNYYGGGYNGGADGGHGGGGGDNGSGGGGASDVRQGGSATSNRVIAAGGGGGSGGDFFGAGGNGGDGGGVTGVTGGTGTSSGNVGGSGGTSSAGGTAGGNGTAGSSATGGAGGIAQSASGGGGGGGYYGGGGGGSGSSKTGGGGGGGSSYAGTGTSATTHTQGYRSGNGQVIITESVAPTITSPTKTSISATTATLGGNVTSDGGATVSGRGVCVGTSINPAIGGTCFTASGTTGVFTVSATSLSSGTLYHYRAYATNSVGTSYTTDDSFTTLAVPTITSPTKTSISATNATLGGNVTSDGGATVTGRGVCVGTSINPAIGGTCFTASGTTGVFTVSATSLSSGTLYHYRAYATNSVGTSYTTDDSFTTLAVPTITSPTKTSISATNATLGGNVTSDGGATVTGRGVCVGTSINPAIGGTCFTASGTTGVFTVSATSLSSGTLYHYRAYATNSIGTSYTTDDTFTTGIPTAPTVNLSQETNVGSISTTLSGLVNPNSAATVGWYNWGTSNVACSNFHNSTTSQPMGSGAGSVALTAALEGFVPGLTYYYCIVASNIAGVTYSNVSSFTQTSGSGCTSVNLTSHHTVSSSCTFGNTTVDGVDKGTGTKNDAILTVAKGTTLTVGSNQTVAYGFIYKPGATVVRLTGGSLRRGAIWVPDTDGDGYPDNLGTKNQIMQLSQPSGYARRAVISNANVDCSPNDATKFKNFVSFIDVDADGYTTTSSQQLVCSGNSLAGATQASSGVDCLDSNANLLTNRSTATDVDQDGKSTSTADTQCAGVSTTVSGRTYYKDASGAYAYVAAADIIATSDCLDSNANIHQNVSVATDADQDGSSTSTAASACVGASSTVSGRTYYVDSAGVVNKIASASIITTSDCNEASAIVQTNKTVVTDVDADGFGISGETFCLSQATGDSVGCSANSSRNVPGVCYVTGEVAGADCDDTNVNIYQTRTVATDVDQDGYSIATAASACVGASSTVSGRTYYRDSASAVVKVDTVSIIATSDCLDSNATVQTSKSTYADADGDGYTVSTASGVCMSNATGSSVGCSANYSKNASNSCVLVVSAGADCYDSNANAKPGQTAYYSVHRGDGGFDYNCSSVEDKLYNHIFAAAAGAATGYGTKYYIESSHCGYSQDCSWCASRQLNYWVRTSGSSPTSNWLTPACGISYYPCQSAGSNYSTYCSGPSDWYVFNCTLSATTQTCR